MLITLRVLDSRADQTWQVIPQWSSEQIHPPSHLITHLIIYITKWLSVVNHYYIQFRRVLALNRYKNVNFFALFLLRCFISSEELM